MCKYFGRFVPTIRRHETLHNILTFFMFKALFYKYFLPTPIEFRLIGDTLLIISAGIVPFETYFAPGTFKIVIIAGVIGKILTNFATYKSQ